MRKRTKKGDWSSHSRTLHHNILDGIPYQSPQAREPPPWRAEVPRRVLYATLGEGGGGGEAAERGKRGSGRSWRSGHYRLHRRISGEGCFEMEAREWTAYNGKRDPFSWYGPAGSVCSSYTEEMVAMDRAVSWLG